MLNIQMNNFRKIFNNLIAAEPLASLLLANNMKQRNGAAMTGFAAESITAANENKLFQADSNLKPAFLTDENTHTIVEITTVIKEVNV